MIRCIVLALLALATFARVATGLPQDSASQPAAETTLYEVKPGDTLESIAQSWFGDPAKAALIVKANPGVDAAKLTPGQILRLPFKDARLEDVQPIPAGDVKVLQAVILKVEGDRAQWRPGPKDAFQQAKVDDALSPGAEIRTGPKSRIVLRVGMNASLLVDAQTRVALPEVIQAGGVLRTRVDMKFGQADFKVDKVGLSTDLEVATPSATIAVKGTGWRVVWNAVDGFQAYGIPTNELRAIEVAYVSGLVVYLTSNDFTTDVDRLPALAAFANSFWLPLDGALTPPELIAFRDHPDRVIDREILQETGIEILYSSRALEHSIQRLCDRFRVPGQSGDCNPDSSRGEGGSRGQ